MEKEKALVLVKEKVNDVLNYAGKTGSFDKEAIHKFRVSVKILRSLLRMFRLRIDDPRLKIPRKFKRLYHIAGAIRDATLELEKLENYKDGLPHYIGRRQKLIERQKNEWIRYYSINTFVKLKTRLKNVEYEPLPTTLIGEFIKLRLASVIEIIHRNEITDDQLHDVRKNLKDIQNILKTIKKNWKKGYAHLAHFPVQEISHITDLIGEYNDKRMALKRMSAYSSPVMNTEEKKNMKAICDKMSDELATEKVNIIDSIRDFIHALPRHFFAEV